MRFISRKLRENDGFCVSCCIPSPVSSRVLGKQSSSIRTPNADKPHTLNYRLSSWLCIPSPTSTPRYGIPSHPIHLPRTVSSKPQTMSRASTMFGAFTKSLIPKSTTGSRHMNTARDTYTIHRAHVVGRHRTCGSCLCEEQARGQGLHQMVNCFWRNDGVALTVLSKFCFLFGGTTNGR